MWHLDKFDDNSSDDEEDWESLFKELCEYKRQLGHANPKRSVPQLGEWAYQMRTLYAQNASGAVTTLTEDRIAKLVGIGFNFVVIEAEEELHSKKNGVRKKDDHMDECFICEDGGGEFVSQS